MLSFLQKYASPGRYSQNGETGILNEALRRMGIDKGRCIEIGANDGCYCSNTAELIEKGWSGLFVEVDYNLYRQCVSNWKHNPLVRCQCSRVDENNVNAFVDERCDLLSLDTDGSDYRIFHVLKAKPKIVIIEIDSSYPPNVIAFNPNGAGTYRNTVELGIEKGFFLLVHTGNIVLIANEYRHLFSEVIGNGLSNAELYFNRAWLQESVT